jgi:signal transduction histidine kinase
MQTFRLSRLTVGVSASFAVLTLVACGALKIVTDIMEARATELAIAAVNRADAPRLMQLEHGVETWGMIGDYVALAVAGLVLGGTILVVVGMYQNILGPLSAMASAMKRFSDGERAARAKPSAGIELSTVATTFNEMADTLTGQHQRMLDFLGGTTHELKDPVLVMRAALQEFGPGKSFPTEQLARQRLAVISRELDRLDRMVENYLDASHVEWQRLDLQQGKEDLRARVQQVSWLYERFSPAHRTELSLPERPVWVFADPERLTQVIHTLLTNAIAFSPRGGAVEVGLSCQGGETILSVTDHGVGISEEDLATIFEPFQKVSSALQNSPGAAVALSVAQRIIQAHRGRIEVSSKLGQGSTFRVHLPLASSIAAEDAASGRAAPDRHLSAQDGHSSAQT